MKLDGFFFGCYMQKEWVMLVLFLLFPSVKNKPINKNETTPSFLISTRLLLKDSLPFAKWSVGTEFQPIFILG